MNRPQEDIAPEAHNDEQDDERSQAQTVANEARGQNAASPADSRKASASGDESAPDLVDHMRDMETSGRIDMSAYRGEPNHDDNVDKYGKGQDDDGLRGDGS